MYVYLHICVRRKREETERKRDVCTVYVKFGQEKDVYLWISFLKQKYMF